MTLLDHYQAILIFLLVGVAMVVAPMVMLALLRPRKPSLAKAIPYECGKDPIGDAQVCFDLRFYSDALIFVIFDVEAAFMFPWARVYKDFAARGQSGFALVEGAIFVGVLFLGLIYVWAKGDIDWVKSLNALPGVVRREGVAPTMPEGPREFEPADQPEPATTAVPPSLTAVSREH
jgi:NADH-quinone oxidoreductase subunit A